MHIITKRILKTMGMTLAAMLLVVCLLLAGLAMWLQTDSAKQILLQTSVDLLQDKINTNVKADSVSVKLLKGQVRLYGMQVNDREDSLLLRFNELHVGINPNELLNRKVLVTDLELIDADARLWRDSLTNNFKFIIDAFKKKKGVKKKKKNAPKFELLVNVNEVNIQRLHFKWDVRHKIRKNILNPHRGSFDANHVDAMLSMKASVTQPRKGVYDISLNKIDVYDKLGKLRINHLNAKAQVSKQDIKVSDVSVKLGDSRVDMEPFTINLKTKSIDTPFELKAKVILKDIAQPFAPVLSNFTTPLLLTTKVSGPLKCLNVDDIYVQTPDKRLTLKARGTLDGLFGKKEGLNLQFRDINMKATHNMKEQIVMHFAKKMRIKMMRQMKALGDITFNGSVDVKYKREIIAGKLHTEHGDLTTRFTIDGFTHYMTGFIKTYSMDLGKVMNIADLGPVNCIIDFDLNISKKTPRPATALPNGRLPMGKVTARVYDANYSTVSVPNVNLSVVSDGSTASGYLWIPGLLKNMSARISYVQTDSQQELWFHFTHNAQQWLLKEGVNLLSDKLQADVKADSIDVHLFDGHAKLYGIRVQDRQDNPLLSIDTLRVSLNPQELMRHTVHITNIDLYGLQAQLSKDSLSSNFHFIIDSFKKNKKHKHKHAVARKKKANLKLIVDLQKINIENLRIKWDDRAKARKNLNNPKRGAFDANHIDLQANMQMAVKQAKAGGYDIDLINMNLVDYASGLQFEEVKTHVKLREDMLQVDGMDIRMAQSWIRIEPFRLNFDTNSLADAFKIEASIVLQDIARPFAPVLRNFTTPLQLQAIISGGINDLQVSDLNIQTPNGMLDFGGNGVLGGITGKKEALNLKFSNIALTSDNETLMTLVMHFSETMRLKMVRQMKAIGNIKFHGNLDIHNKHEFVSGQLNTDFGTVETDFTLDGNTHMMKGYIDAQELDAAKFLNIKPLGKLNCHIDFDFNTSSKAPCPATALPNGRLPQGHIQALVRNARFGWLHAKRIETNLDSDGSTATGSIRIPRIIADLIINFNYVQTDEEQHIKVRPKYKFHKPILWRRKKTVSQ